VSDAITGPGFLLQMGDGGGPEVFTTIAEVRDISGPQQSVDLVEVTNQSSPDGYEEHKPTIKRSGEVDFPVNFIPDDPTHDDTTGIISKLNGKTLTNFRMQLNNTAGSFWSFAAYCTAFATGAAVAGVLTGTVKLKIVGKPVLTV
jgi:hypothetical protein